jgi:hypothetical protein
MKLKVSRRLVLVTIFMIALGYCSAAVSILHCDAAMDDRLPRDTPLDATRHSSYADPSRLFLPFVNTASFEQNCRLATGEWQLETGTSYYLSIFGVVVPLWTASETVTHIN